MKFARLLTLVAIFPVATAADEIDTDIDYSQLNETEFVAGMRDMQEAMWDDAFIIYTRIDPSIEDLVPAFEWTADHETAFSCFYNYMSERDALAEVNGVRDDAVKMMDTIRSTPGMNLLTMDEFPDVADAMTPPDIYTAGSIECEVFSLNAKVMQESGLFAAIQKFYTD